MSQSAELRLFLRHIIEQRSPLSRDQARTLLSLILAGEATDIELAALLGALAARGETPEELAGFVDAMRSAATPLPLTDAERSTLVDTCGTGGDASGTFNISTAAALVAAAAGADSEGRIMVAKHGNRAVTSRSGSADVLEALGIPVDLTPAAAAAALRAHRFTYLHAPTLHPTMKAVMPVRRGLGVRTVFNLLGPLTNPAGARAQVMGVYAADRVPLVAQTMLLLDTRHAFVVHGEDEAGCGLDEISISGPTQFAEIREGRVSFQTLTPEQFGLVRAPLSALRGGDAAANAAILQAIFAGEPGPGRDIVLLNAAAVLVVAGCVKDLHAGIDLARQAIVSGAVTRLLRDLAVP